ncbi:MarR family winged helix-turn-helix transcriptional regulator [Alteromonas sp. H39]|uniref:MarR family winged helix-turn-helix transcriptional regulator n=1 Tax=Alteromonas sp. H39 TaxID=3389876 RepID=UPI0039E00D46
MLARAEKQWSEIHPDLPVADATLLGGLIGVAANLDAIGVSVLKQYGLGQSEHDVLACARRQTPPYIATPGLLLEEVRITSGALTTCINRLHDKKLLKRVHADNDQRSKPIALTAKGKALIDDVTAHRFELARTLLSAFSEQEKATLKAMLMKLGQITTDVPN